MKESKDVNSIRMPRANDDIKEKEKMVTPAVQVKPFPGKVPDAGVFAQKFNVANEVGSTIKGIKQREH